MARITKSPEERKSEIIDTAEKLFCDNGYKETAISDIVKTIKVAQGTFYYYFKSKEDVVLAVFDKYLQSSLESMKAIIDDSSLSPENKYEKVLDIQFSTIKKCQKISAEIHSEENAGIHQRVIINTIEAFTPIYEALVREGIAAGNFTTEHPNSISEFILLIIYFLFDPGMFHLSRADYEEKLDALTELITRALQFKNQNDNYFSMIKKKSLDLYDTICSK